MRPYFDVEMSTWDASCGLTFSKTRDAYAGSLPLNADVGAFDSTIYWAETEMADELPSRVEL